MKKRIIAFLLVLVLLMTTIICTIGCKVLLNENANKEKQIQEVSHEKEITLYELANANEIIEESDVIQNSIQKQEKLEAKNEKEIRSVSMMAVGDDLIHSGVYNDAYNADGTYNFDFIFENLKNDISSYDLAVINQETILVDDYSKVSSYPCFGTPTALADSIVDAGFDIVLSATNHTWDKKSNGVDVTLDYWKTNYPEITLLGINESVEDYEKIDIIQRNGIDIALFNYTYGLNGFVLPKDECYKVNLLENKDKFISDVKTAEELADITICFLHIGEEYTYLPTKYQTNYIKDLIDAGADIIVCAHPHVVEPFGIVSSDNGNEALVYYSCGNFVSHQNEVPRLLGGMAEFNIEKVIEDGKTTVTVSDYNFIPLVTHYSQDTHTVYKLQDYNDELAAKHSIKKKAPSFSTEGLWMLWEGIMGEYSSCYIDEE